MIAQCPQCPLRFSNRFHLSDHLERDHNVSDAVVDALQPAHIRHGLLRARREGLGNTSRIFPKRASDEQRKLVKEVKQPE